MWKKGPCVKKVSHQVIFYACTENPISLCIQIFLYDLNLWRHAKTKEEWKLGHLLSMLLSLNVQVKSWAHWVDHIVFADAGPSRSIAQKVVTEAPNMHLPSILPPQVAEQIRSAQQKAALTGNFLIYSTYIIYSLHVFLSIFLSSFCLPNQSHRL